MWKIRMMRINITPRALIMAAAVAALSVKLTWPAAADFQDGWRAHQKGDFATALKEWRPLADGDDARSQFNLGIMYYEERGVAQDTNEAIR
jgi:TPR repeat protein